MADLTLAEKKEGGEELRSLLEESRFDLSDLMVTDDSAGKCWFDGQPCPYGDPKGRFVETPVDYCRECYIVIDHTASLEKLFGAEIWIERNKEFEQSIRKEISFDSVNLLDLLNKLITEDVPYKRGLREFIRILGDRLKLEEVLVVTVDKVMEE